MWKLADIWNLLFGRTTVGWRSWYSDWLRSGWQRGRSLGPGRVKCFLHVIQTCPGAQRASIQWVPGALSSGVKLSERGSDHSPTSAEVKKMWMHITTPSIRLHDVVLNLLSTVTILPFLRTTVGERLLYQICVLFTDGEAGENGFRPIPRLTCRYLKIYIFWDVTPCSVIEVYWRYSAFRTQG
jgi:hypothetical protein